MKKWYVGRKHRHAGKIVFSSMMVPTIEVYGKMYASVVGPFRTKRAAILLASFGENNPHIRHVRDAERIAKGEET
jgi:hypothetical protein